MSSNSIQSNPIRSDPFQSYPIQSNSIQSIPIQSNPIKSNQSINQANQIKSNQINQSINQIKSNQPINQSTKSNQTKSNQSSKSNQIKSINQSINQSINRLQFPHFRTPPPPTSLSSLAWSYRYCWSVVQGVPLSEVGGENGAERRPPPGNQAQRPAPAPHARHDRSMARNRSVARPISEKSLPLVVPLASNVHWRKISFCWF